MQQETILEQLNLPHRDNVLTYSCDGVDVTSNIPYYTSPDKIDQILSILENFSGRSSLLVGTGPDLTADSLAKLALANPADLFVVVEPMDLESQSIAGLTPEEASKVLQTTSQPAVILKASVGDVPSPYCTSTFVDITANQNGKTPLFDQATLVFPDPINVIPMVINTLSLIKPGGYIDIVALQVEIEDDILPAHKLPSRLTPYNISISVVDSNVQHNMGIHPDTKLKDIFFNPQSFRIGRVRVEKH